ncbi:PREDICTED: N-glycosylase/DNA lyase, partial [Crocodylus porosus]|uniref:N-glycosylase/DNA lyase n=1 Tax=Crocodylus porosus TaxID=8502 RepID=UPI0009400AEA
ARLRELGFGYRARFVSGAAQAVLRDLGAEGLERLRSVPYAEAQRVLCSLPGVGAKVADCVCLMALDKPEAVPVDTHVWQVARQRYGLELGTAARSLTPRVYRETGDFFRRLWGPRAGWAQAVSAGGPCPAQGVALVPLSPLLSPGPVLCRGDAAAGGPVCQRQAQAGPSLSQPQPPGPLLDAAAEAG